MQPPREIDGAEVVLWAWSEPGPFFVMPSTDGASVPVHGLAICRTKSGSVYRFSCNSAWESENDSPYSSVEDATRGESAQYDVDSVQWQRFVASGAG
jgi:hypothetical protein